MSGWQRIGAVISILWLVGFPIFLFIDANRSHSEVLQYCLKAASESREPTEREGSRQICLRAFEASRETPGKLVKELASDKILWAAMFGPIALLWIVGGVISYVVRWIAPRALKGARNAALITRSIRRLFLGLQSTEFPSDAK
jgi:hypothetical protein